MERTSKLEDWKLQYTIYENLTEKIRYKLYDKTAEKLSSTGCDKTTPQDPLPKLLLTTDKI